MIIMPTITEELAWCEIELANIKAGLFSMYSQDYIEGAISALKLGKGGQVMEDDSISWGELAELTHATQVERFGWCICEDTDGQGQLADDCPVGEGECDKCANSYDLSSRDNRCGNCGNCGSCCTHKEEESK